MLALLIVFLALLPPFILASRSPALTIETANGPITGHSSPNRPTVIEYLGVRYAQPPLGALRFAPLQKYTSKRTYVAANWVRCSSDSCDGL